MSPRMSFSLVVSVALSLSTIWTRPCLATVIHQLGLLEMDLRSDQAPETNKLLKTVLSVTTDFLYKAYINSNDASFQNIQCSIESFTLDGSKVNDDATGDGDMSPYSALISIIGQVTFQDSTQWTQDNVTDFNTVAFSMADSSKSFFHSLMEYSTDDPFLSNITYAAVKVNGAVIDEGDVKNDTGSQSDDPPLEVWMIALIGGLGAFVVVLCVVITCICCIPIDDSMSKANARQFGVHGTNPTRSDSKMDEHMRFDEMESKAPSPGKSIGSQDSSIFTYNPKSVRSYDSGRRSYNSYFTYGTHNQGMEMDISHMPDHGASGHHDIRPAHATTISANQISFGQDISAIEPKKGDLSLIEEDGETESSAAGSASVQSDVVSPLPSFRAAISPSNTFTNNTVSSAAPSRASGKYKSLLASMSSSGGKSISSGGLSKSIIAQKYLTEAAIEDMEKQDRLDELNTRVGSWKDDPASNMLNSSPSMPHIDNIPCRPSDEDTEDSTSYGPRYFDPHAPPQRRLNLGGSAEEVMNDLQELSTQIDQIRSTSSSVSGRTAIRLRR
jgi:hypothetical protein